MTCACLAALLSNSFAQNAGERSVNARSDPHWEGYRNLLRPKNPSITRQHFGYHTNGETAEVGGWVNRSLTPAYWARPISTKTLEDELTASGKFRVRRADGSSGALFGWFNETSRGWRTPNSLAFRVDGNGGKYWVFFEYGTRNWFAGSGVCFEGERYQTTKTKPFPADGTVHEWKMTYDPSGEKGHGVIRFILDGKLYTCTLSHGHKSAGAVFNRFGIFNHQTTGGGMEVYFSDLTLDDRPVDLRSGWVGKGNQTEFEEPIIRPYHQMGYFPGDAASGSKGKIGGIMWRDEKPAYYADKVGPFTLDDELFASGKLSFNGAGTDSGIYLGWFDSASKTNNLVPENVERQKNLLAILIEGPSRIGHYFRPAYFTASGEGRHQDSGPIIQPDGTVHTWSLHYSPSAADGKGQITVTFDGNEQTLSLKPEHRQAGARFDRFGFCNFQDGGQQVDVSVDDLRYTADRISR